MLDSGLTLVMSLAPTYAQSTSATIQGLVTDRSGAVIANVVVIVHNVGTLSGTGFFRASLSGY
jgi:hypothetical protein